MPSLMLAKHSNLPQLVAPPTLALEASSMSRREKPNALPTPRVMPRWMPIWMKQKTKSAGQDETTAAMDALAPTVAKKICSSPQLMFLFRRPDKWSSSWGLLHSTRALQAATADNQGSTLCCQLAAGQAMKCQRESTQSLSNSALTAQSSQLPAEGTHALSKRPYMQQDGGDALP